jgi:hypothetical protein
MAPHAACTVKIRTAERVQSLLEEKTSQATVDKKDLFVFGSAYRLNERERKGERAAARMAWRTRGGTNGVANARRHEWRGERAAARMAWRTRGGTNGVANARRSARGRRDRGIFISALITNE